MADEVLLETRSLTKYFGGVRAVHDFNLGVRQNEIMGLIGPNGAGKTTVFNVVTGVYGPTSGSVFFGGEDITGLEPHVIVSKGITRTFQNIRLFPNLTVLENVKVAYSYVRKSTIVQSLLRNRAFLREESSITERSMALLDRFRLAGRHSEIVRNLPYGEQRRVEVVRAIGTNPSLLLLDEPAAGMNPSELDSLIELILWVKQEFRLTVIVIEHQMRMIMNLCPRIRVMDFGETVTDGTPDQVRANPDVITAYLGRRATSAS
ncbi:MAG: ABC transporter ATP-binding protein [Bacillota bacterium]|nr:ABC transporter ATP-binding protein [Bacillota bacterium]